MQESIEHNETIEEPDGCELCERRKGALKQLESESQQLQQELASTRMIELFLRRELDEYRNQVMKNQQDQIAYYRKTQQGG